jgi:3-hydroxyisobutyrate dehydrogenase
MSKVPDTMNVSREHKVTFLGLGAMGRRMARRIADAGVDLAVWSRSGISAELPGARAAQSAREAVTGARVVLSMVRDDDASREVWLGSGGALSALSPGAVVVEHSTLGPAWVTELGQAAEKARVRFLHVPVVGSRPQAETGSLVLLAGGPSEVVELARPILALVGGAIHEVGAPAAAAYAKLAVNTLFAVQVAAVAEMFGLAEKASLSPQVLLGVLEGLPVLSPSAKGAAATMIAGRFEPMFPVELVRKDLLYSLAAAAALDGHLPVGEGAARVFESAIEAGLSAENLTAVVKLYR